jgi:dethiobiotin synthetase
MIVETAGGLLVPVNENFLFADLVKPMHLPILIVAENRLGAINQVLLTIETARSRDLPILGVVLNQTRPDKIPDELLNAELIEEFGKVKILCKIGYLEEAKREERMTSICAELALRIEPSIREFGAIRTGSRS